MKAAAILFVAFAALVVIGWLRAFAGQPGVAEVYAGHRCPPGTVRLDIPDFGIAAQVERPGIGPVVVCQWRIKRK